MDGLLWTAEAQSTGSPLRNHVERAPALFHRRLRTRGLYLHAISTKSSSSLGDDPLGLPCLWTEQAPEGVEESPRQRNRMMWALEEASTPGRVSRACFLHRQVNSEVSGYEVSMLVEHLLCARNSFSEVSVQVS